MTQLATQPEEPRREPANAMVSMLERVLMDPTVPVERLERLLELQDKERQRQAKSAFIVSMAQMQPLLPTIDRNGKITIYNKDDVKNNAASPRIVQSTKFAAWEDIAEAIRPMLGEYGFTLAFGAERVGDQVVVTGFLRHSDGHEERTSISLALDGTGSKNNVQAVGSSISYGKRYTAGMLLNIISRAKNEADDDGQATGSAVEYATPEQMKELHALMTERGISVEKVLAVARKENITDITKAQIPKLLERMRMKQPEAPNA